MSWRPIAFRTKSRLLLQYMSQMRDAGSRQSIGGGGHRMRCVLCRYGETKPGTGTVTLERGSTTLVIKGVPASVCANCDERYYDEEVTAHLLALAEEAVQAGVHVDVREYRAEQPLGRA